MSLWCMGDEYEIYVECQCEQTGGVRNGITVEEKRKGNKTPRR